MTVLITNQATKEVLRIEDAIEVVRAAFSQLEQGDATFQPRTELVFSMADNEYYCWGSHVGATRSPPRLALRFKSDLLTWSETENGVVEEKYNVEPGTFMGMILLFDMTTGELLGLLNDGVIQQVRVGATAGVACELLARADASTVGILGSGGMARVHAEAFSAVRDIAEINVYSPTKRRRDAFAAEMDERLSATVNAVSSPDEAMTNVDIAATCTSATHPIFDPAWLEPGMFLTNVSSAELDDKTLASVDRTITTVNTSTKPYCATEDELRGYQARRGDLETDAVSYPTIGQILAGHEAPRETDSEIICFRNRSTGIQFAAVGSLVYERATQAGLGVALPLEWFQQNIRS